MTVRVRVPYGRADKNINPVLGQFGGEEDTTTTTTRAQHYHNPVPVRYLFENLVAINIRYEYRRLP